MSIDLEAIRARAEAATPGPWKTSGAFVYVLNEKGTNHFSAGISHAGPDSAGEDERKAVAEFIACAREDVPALVAEVERLRELLDQAVDKLPEGYTVLRGQIFLTLGYPLTPEQAADLALVGQATNHT